MYKERANRMKKLTQSDLKPHQFGRVFLFNGLKQTIFCGYNTIYRLARGRLHIQYDLVVVIGSNITEPPSSEEREEYTGQVDDFRIILVNSDPVSGFIHLTFLDLGREAILCDTQISTHLAADNLEVSDFEYNLLSPYFWPSESGNFKGLL